ncbi:MAG: hypothetical protein H0V18_14525 [Pyrinomonadaceae bacterium]|jgi:hypothetical protein|nr:hypothetical protein [Pyrinomonadaceae bacterium]
MPQLRTFKVCEIPNLQKGKDRSLAFLICPEDIGIDAKEVFDGLSPEKQRLVKDRFDYWLQRGQHKLYFHGWDNPPYKDCFVFKWKEGRQHQRLYGFLIHPRPLTDNRLEVCVLVSHAQKNTEETDPAELSGANALRDNLDVIRAVKKAYPELSKGLKHGKPLDGKKR